MHFLGKARATFFEVLKKTCAGHVAYCDGPRPSYLPIWKTFAAEKLRHIFFENNICDFWWIFPKFWWIFFYLVSKTWTYIFTDGSIQVLTFVNSVYSGYLRVHVIEKKKILIMSLTRKFNALLLLRDIIENTLINRTA